MASGVHLLRRDEYSRASVFLDAHWQKNHIYCRDRGLFDWTFGQNPYWQDLDCYSVSISESEGEDIGILGIIPFPLNNHGAAKPACWLVNWKVRDDRRSSGAGLKLLRIFRDMGLVTVSFGINDVIARLYRGLIWDIIDNIPRLLWVSPNAVGRLHDLSALCGGHVAIEDLRTLADHRADVVAADAGARLGLADVSAADWDTKGWAPYAASSIGCSREYRYLDWRHLRHPNFTYKTAVVPEGGRLGLAIWRVETIHHRTPEGMVPVDRIIRLVELLPTSAANMKALLGEVRRDALAADAMAIDFYSYHAGINAWAQDDGFVDVNRLPFANGLPSRFQPVDSKGGVIPSAVKVGIAPPSSDGPCDWYWTRSDSDQDRPNI